MTMEARDHVIGGAAVPPFGRLNGILVCEMACEDGPRGRSGTLCGWWHKKSWDWGSHCPAVLWNPCMWGASHGWLSPKRTDITGSKERNVPPCRWSHCRGLWPKRRVITGLWEEDTRRVGTYRRWL